MLVLTRKTGEAIRIGESVTVTVIQSGRGRVRLGIEAPGEVAVHRGEIFDRIQEASVAQSIAESSRAERLSIEVAVADA